MIEDQQTPMSWRRWVAYGLLALVIAAFATVALLRGYYSRDADRWQQWWLDEIGSLDVRDYAPEAVSEKANGAAPLRAAGRLLAGQSGTTQTWLGTLVSKAVGDWTLADRSRFADYLAGQVELISELERLEGTERSSLGIDYAAPEVVRRASAERLLPLWQATRFSAAAGRWSLAEGDCEQAARWVTRLERGVSVLGGEPIVVARLLAIGASGDYLDLLREAVTHCASLEILARLLSATEHLGQHSTPMALALAREGASLWRLRSPPSAVERVLGANALGARSGPLRIYGVLVLAARGAEEKLATLEQQLDAGGATSIVAGILIPNLRAAIYRERSFVTALRLAQRVLEVRSEGLTTGFYATALEGPPPRSAVVEEELSAALEEDGRLRLAFTASRDHLAAQTPAAAPRPHWSDRMEWILPALD